MPNNVFQTRLHCLGPTDKQRLLMESHTHTHTVVFKLDPGADPQAGWMVSQVYLHKERNGDEGRPRCEQAGG